MVIMLWNLLLSWVEKVNSPEHQLRDTVVLHINDTSNFSVWILKLQVLLSLYIYLFICIAVTKNDFFV